MGPDLAKSELGIRWGQPALPWLREAWSALTWSPARVYQLSHRSCQLSPAQPCRWACTHFGPMPRLDGTADRLRAMVSKARFGRELGAKTACAGLPGKAASTTTTVARELQQGSAAAQLSPWALGRGHGKWGSPGESSVLLVTGSASDSPAVCAGAAAILGRQAVVGLRSTCMFPVPGALHLLPGMEAVFILDQVSPKAVIDVG